MLSKNANKKKCAPKLIFFNEKKNQKDLDDSDYSRNRESQILALCDEVPVIVFTKYSGFL